MLNIRCEKCNKIYRLKDKGMSEDDRLQLIKYAKCTNCGNPRDPYQFVQRTAEKFTSEHKDGLCDECGEPVNNKKYNLCHKHYIALWKDATNYNKDYMRKWREKKKSLHFDNQ